MATMNRQNKTQDQAGQAVPADGSREAFAAAERVLVGGVNSPVRAFGAVGGTPVFLARGQGAVMTDLDGRAYIDYVGAWGPLILGHCDERVHAAASKVLSKGWSFGAPTEAETRLAEAIVVDIPSIERVRLVNSGTEAAMSVIRLARGFTGRDLVVKCAGCYHGHVDALLIEAGSGALTFGVPSSAGVPDGCVKDTRVVAYNDLAAVYSLFEQDGPRIAALLVEPVAGNMGCIPPAEGYLAGLRAVCDANGALLVFDEVMTGYRLGLSGAQGKYGVRPDLTCLGKIIGGGLPVGAYGGRAEIMNALSPAGPVYQAGTLAGNPLAMATGLATIEALHETGVYEQLESTSNRLEEGLIAAARRASVPLCINRVGSMVGVFFQEGPVTDLVTAQRSDTQRYARFFHAMLERGVYLPPSQFETLFVSLAHTDEQIDETIVAARGAFTEVAAER